MNRVLELFGKPTARKTQAWDTIVNEQQCPYLSSKCYKVRKSDPDVSIGTCTVLYGRQPRPIIICPTRLIDRRQIFTDCLHLLTTHEPGNELHIVSEVPVPGGSVDYFVVSVRGDRIADFVGVELQTLDTTGTVWPERQRLLAELGVRREDNEEASSKPFGMNWKMTAKTILVQMHHKSQTFEHLNKKLVLVAQDVLVDYMSGEFNFSHLKNPAVLGDSVHLHSYQVHRESDGALRIALDTRLSTDVAGISLCLGLQADARVEIDLIHRALKQRISSKTLFAPI